ncbi:helix-turn-helix domain-containing protein [Fibrella aquatica]|uniref:helix-turn-helix domain-containing protein n=1 Tax=Fibrella aquatica TaxID=3242487 RepID=UPI00352217DC
MPDILTRVRRLREICGFPQEVVADKLGITQAAYSRLENGRTRLDLDRLDQIAKLYGLSQQDMIKRPSAELMKLLIDNPDLKDIWGGVTGDTVMA